MYLHQVKTENRMTSPDNEEFNADITVRSERLMNILNETLHKMEIALVMRTFSENHDHYKHHFSDDELCILSKCMDDEYPREIHDSNNGTIFDEDGDICNRISHSVGNFESMAFQRSSKISIEDFELRYLHSPSYEIAEPMIQKAIELFSKKKELSDSVKTESLSSSFPKNFLRNFLKQMRGLRDAFEKILLEDLSFEEEEERTQHYKEIWKKNEEALSEIEILRPTLANITDRVDNELRSKDDEIRELLCKIENVKAECKEEIKTICAESEMKIAAESILAESKIQTLQSDIKTQQEKLQETLNDDLKKEKDLRSKRYKIETQLESLLDKYDSDMGARQKEYERIKAEFDEEEHQMNILEENFNKQEIEYVALMEEKAEEERMELERKIEDLRCRVAARIIQTRWRDLKRRRLERAKMRKGKKGKGKKKGGRNSPSPKRPESAGSNKKSGVPKKQK